MITEELETLIRWYVDLVSGSEGTDFIGINIAYEDRDKATQLLRIIGDDPKRIETLRLDLDKIEERRKQLGRGMSLVEKWRALE